MCASWPNLRSKIMSQKIENFKKIIYFSLMSEQTLGGLSVANMQDMTMKRTPFESPGVSRPKGEQKPGKSGTRF